MMILSKQLVAFITYKLGDIGYRFDGRWGQRENEEVILFGLGLLGHRNKTQMRSTNAGIQKRTDKTTARVVLLSN